jgi:Bacterial SH3 domain
VRAPVRTVVQRATPLTVMERHGHWYQIITPGGTTGWVASAQELRGIMVDSMAEPGSRGHPRRSIQRAHRKGRGLVRRHAPSRPARIRARISGVRRLQLRGSGHDRPKVSGKKTHAGRSHRAQGARPRRPVHSRISSGSPSARKHPALPARTSGSTSRYQRVLKMLRVRSAPSLRAHVLQLAIPGAYVRVLEQRGAWKHIRLPGGRVGYVYGRYVQ